MLKANVKANASAGKRMHAREIFCRRNEDHIDRAVLAEEEDKGGVGGVGGVDRPKSPLHLHLSSRGAHGSGLIAIPFDFDHFSFFSCFYTFQSLYIF